MLFRSGFYSLTFASRRALSNTVNGSAISVARSLSAFTPPRLFDYETVTNNLTVKDGLDAVEACFSALARDKVDVPIPMHIGPLKDENGDCHIKGGYVKGDPTFTVKLAMVSFYNNIKMNPPLPPGSGIFMVVSAITGAPLGVFQENRFMTDLRTGAAGGVSFKYCTTPNQKYVGFIGCGAIARNMARAAAAIRPYEGICYAVDDSDVKFAKDMEAELGIPFKVVSSAKKLCEESDVIFTQTPGASTVLEKSWLKDEGVTIIASGSDQPTKQEIPNDVLAAGKYIPDLTKQTSRVGELRGALQSGIMKESDVYAELGQIVNGEKPGREGNEIIVVDLTGTGAQDAAIGQVAWDKLSQL